MNKLTPNEPAIIHFHFCPLLKPENKSKATNAINEIGRFVDTYPSCFKMSRCQHSIGQVVVVTQWSFPLIQPSFGKLTQLAQFAKTSHAW